MNHLPPGPFGVILADPPWRFRTWNETNDAKSARRHYSLLERDEIAAIPVRHTRPGWSAWGNETEKFNETGGVFD